MQILNEEIKKNKKFLVAYSGGLDSTVLLHKLLELKKRYSSIKLRAIHINHNLHPSSNFWVEFCQKECDKFGVKLIIKKIFLSKTTGIEEKARLLRYKKIIKNSYPNEIILTAHHLDDQIETFFLCLKRASGSKGLSGISEIIHLSKNKIIRPFLKIKKCQLKKIAIENQLIWIKDPSNKNIQFERNFLRKEIIPKFKKRWPFFLKNCYKSMLIFKEQESIINQLITEKIKNLSLINNGLNITQLKKINKPIQKLILRNWIKKNSLICPNNNFIKQIFIQLVSNKNKKNIKICFKNFEIQKYNDALYWTKTFPSIKKEILLWKNFKNSINLPYNLGKLIINKLGMKIPYPKEKENIQIRFHVKKNEKIFFSEQKKAITIKKIWQMYSIPPWLRNKIPILYYDNQLISALGVFVIHTKKINSNLYISWTNSIKEKKDKFPF
ncbi:tRNA lysidine(34) synthetase TilS [Buchnera aphidicola]|uniref:tRNA lysidine(34) synthetase TilS n=1 Tax=Buchnera aphidicola TaxID=9 RepID=UPI0034648B9D